MSCTAWERDDQYLAREIAAQGIVILLRETFHVTTHSNSTESGPRVKDVCGPNQALMRNCRQIERAKYISEYHLVVSYYLFTRDAVQDGAYRSTSSSAVSTLPGEQQQQCSSMWSLKYE